MFSGTTQHDTNTANCDAGQEIVMDTETFPISESNIVVIPAIQAENIGCSQIESPGYHFDQVNSIVRCSMYIQIQMCRIG